MDIQLINIVFHHVDQVILKIVGLIYAFLIVLLKIHMLMFPVHIRV